MFRSNADTQFMCGEMKRQTKFRILWFFSLFSILRRLEWRMMTKTTNIRTKWRKQNHLRNKGQKLEQKNIMFSRRRRRRRLSFDSKMNMFGSGSKDRTQRNQTTVSQSHRLILDMTIVRTTLTTKQHCVVQ